MKKHLITLLVIGVFTMAGFVLSLFSPEAADNPKPPTPPPASGGEKATDVSPQDRQKAKEVAERFIRAYIPYDAKAPTKYVNAIKPYAAKELFEMHSKQPRRPELQVVSRTVKQLKSFQVDESSTKNVMWNIVTTEVTTLSTKKTVQQEKSYWLTLVKEQGTWKVKEMQVATNGGE